MPGCAGSMAVIGEADEQLRSEVGSTSLESSLSRWPGETGFAAHQDGQTCGESKAKGDDMLLARYTTTLLTPRSSPLRRMSGFIELPFAYNHAMSKS